MPWPWLHLTRIPCATGNVGARSGLACGERTPNPFGAVGGGGTTHAGTEYHPTPRRVRDWAKGGKVVKRQQYNPEPWPQMQAVRHGQGKQPRHGHSTVTARSQHGHSIQTTKATARLEPQYDHSRSQHSTAQPPHRLSTVKSRPRHSTATVQPRQGKKIGPWYHWDGTGAGVTRESGGKLG